jgi:hypothetical protein
VKSFSIRFTTGSTALVRFNMSYEIPEKSRHSFQGSLCLAPNRNSMCQNIALKHRCFQQNNCITPSSSNQYGKWYITMECRFLSCNYSKYYTLSFNQVRQITDCSHISLSVLLSCQHLVRHLTDCIQIPIHPLQDTLFAPINNTVDQRINTDCSQISVPANVGVCTAPVPLIPCAFTWQNPATSHAVFVGNPVYI